jgi:hypothetical protein
MKREWKLAAIGLSCGVLLMSSLVFAADKEKEKTTGKDAKATAEMEAWMKAATPGEQHKNLNFFVGDWKTQNTMWMEGSETKTEGTAHMEWAMDGRYVISKHSGNFMGMPFQGMGIDGYDNINARYFSIWIDNMSTSYMTSDGTASADGKTFTYKGSMKDPAGKMVHHRMVSTVTGPDSFKFEMFMSPDNAKEEKAMEILYTRVKS